MRSTRAKVRSGTSLLAAALTALIAGLGTAAFAAEAPPDRYPDHSQLMVYADDAGTLQPVRAPADWARRRADILGGMAAAMGPLPAGTSPPPFDLRQTEELAGDGFLRRTYTFAVETGDRLAIDLYLPQPLAAGERRAAMLALHPTGAPGKRLVGVEGTGTNRQYGVELAQRGYVVLAPDYPSFGESADYDFEVDEYISGTMKAIYDNIRAVDLLQSLPEVDGERIGVIGHSLGGHNSMFTAVFEPRIKVIVSNCGFTRFHKYYEGKLKGWTSTRYMPLIDSRHHNNPDEVPFDFTEIVAAFAPRPFLASSPLHDGNFEVSGVRDVIAAAKPIYALYDAEENLQANYPDCEHDFPPDVRKVAYGFIDRHLKR